MSYPYPLPYPASRSAASLITRPSFLGTVHHIYTVDGPAGFFRGLRPCFLRAFPVNAAALFVSEGLMTILGAEKVNFRWFRHLVQMMTYSRARHGVDHVYHSSVLSVSYVTASNSHRRHQRADFRFRRVTFQSRQFIKRVVYNLRKSGSLRRKQIGSGRTSSCCHVVYARLSDV